MKKSMVRSERGFTLVELLATIVILGIIAAIAVPSIGKLIENTKEDTHKANAMQIIEAARLYVLSEDPSASSVNAKTLSREGFLEAVPKNPSGEGPYSTANVDIKPGENGKKSYTITLNGSGMKKKEWTEAQLKGTDSDSDN
ncbi:type II secretion system protein [Alkalihalobacillus sp. TS-13]|uniref:type II secretion system protein n=1 Tax=Alkalihalobacillus sp. TS-13 TaxID=2842455 RepID=UPI001C87BB90|nr:prepilin-type N-terminal cleavage/methylation domain-containing protein [Alkalihalobacillus sp. TS-13]